MKIANLSLPHPVLGLGDDVKGDYEVKFSVDLNQDNTGLIIRHDLRNKTLEYLIKTGKAKYSVEVHCMQTFYRDSFSSTETEQNIIIPSSQLRNNVVVHFYITAKEDIGEYHIEGSNPDYEGYKINVGKGDVLAYGGRVTFPALKDWEALQAVTSFMEIQEYPDAEGPMHFILTGSKIIVKIPREDKKRYDLYKKVRELVPVFHSEIVLPALIHALYQMNASSEEFENLDWYQILDYRLNEEERFKNIDKKNPQEYPRIAQMLLENPVSRSLKSGIAPLLERGAEE